jgi:hypothetical protein
VTDPEYGTITDDDAMDDYDDRPDGMPLIDDDCPLVKPFDVEQPRRRQRNEPDDDRAH